MHHVKNTIWKSIGGKIRRKANQVNQGFPLARREKKNFAALPNHRPNVEAKPVALRRCVNIFSNYEVIIVNNFNLVSDKYLDTQY